MFHYTPNIFSVYSNSIAGSAVCVYNMSSLSTAFEGPFKYQESIEHAWVRHPNPNVHNKCTNDNNAKRSSSRSQDDDARLHATLDFQLMDQAVMSREAGPLIMRENERWTHIVVDHVILINNEICDVLFLATDDGKVRKMVHLPETKQTCLVEEIKIVQNGHPKPVKNMKISPEKGAVYINTHGDLLKVPFERCYRFTTARGCIRSQDPYCAWDPDNGICARFPIFDPDKRHWEQDFRGCPVLDDPVHGGWSDWSTWHECDQVGRNQMIDKCLCRSRTCDNPRPAFNGMKCSGANMEVSNCTVNGQWTEWSAWGACDHTCGMAWRKRHRQCGSPPPQFGGRMCTGKDVQTELCEGAPSCPFPVDGKWSTWAGWSTCTSNCDGGMQTRKRGCDNPKPMRKGLNCTGNDQEWRLCNVHECPEIGKNSHWTDWITTNKTIGGVWRQRFRFKCRANVESSKSIKIGFAKAQSKFCLKGGDCYRKKELASSVTHIDTFTAIDRSLHKFCKSRRQLFRRYTNCRTLGVFLVCKKQGKG
ncbi:semaphorin-5B-like [Elysia marginata]|uniref:Semaphorin-5B-like n=1 Tax=Elysia marginata TaxID=1093978 RepID=A0AAV4H5H5_9GAST|nr:semaphorin-5B-like [Elysia marginata]